MRHPHAEGFLLLLCGLPASGKTTIARRLAARRGAIRLSPDLQLHAHGIDGHDTAARDRVEAEQWLHAQALLRQGHTVVLENGFWSRAERTAYRNTARQLGCRVELHVLDVPMDELARRVTARNAHLPPGSFVVTPEQIRSWAHFFEVPDDEERARFDPPPLHVQPPLPPAVRPLLADLTAGLLARLGRQVRGLYVFGSLVTGDFDPEVSDVDLLAVLDGPLSASEFDRVAALIPELVGAHPHWDDRIEVLLADVAALAAFREGTGALACVSPGEPFHLLNVRQKTSINWHIARESGVALVGPPAAELLPAMSQDEVRAEALTQLHRFVTWIGSETRSGALAYGVLTIARSWHTGATGVVHSKRDSAAWAKSQLPAFGPLVDRAWAVRAARGEGTLDTGDAARFAQTVAQLAQTGRAEGGQPQG